MNCIMESKTSKTTNADALFNLVHSDWWLISRLTKKMKLGLLELISSPPGQILWQMSVQHISCQYNTSYTFVFSLNNIKGVACEVACYRFASKSWKHKHSFVTKLRTSYLRSKNLLWLYIAHVWRIPRCKCCWNLLETLVAYELSLCWS